jgi:hypothetical protein
MHAPVFRAQSSMPCPQALSRKRHRPYGDAENQRQNVQPFFQDENPWKKPYAPSSFEPLSQNGNQWKTTSCSNSFESIFSSGGGNSWKETDTNPFERQPFHEHSSLFQSSTASSAHVSHLPCSQSIDIEMDSPNAHPDISNSSCSTFEQVKMPECWALVPYVRTMPPETLQYAPSPPLLLTDTAHQHHNEVHLQPPNSANPFFDFSTRNPGVSLCNFQPSFYQPLQQPKLLFGTACNTSPRKRPRDGNDIDGQEEKKKKESSVEVLSWH